MLMTVTSLFFSCFLAAVETPRLVTGVKSSGVNNRCTGSLQVFLVCGSLLIRAQPLSSQSHQCIMHPVHSVTYCNCMPDMHRSCKPLTAKPWNKPFKVTLLNYISNPISASWLQPGALPMIFGDDPCFGVHLRC